MILALRCMIYNLSVMCTSSFSWWLRRSHFIHAACRQ